MLNHYETSKTTSHFLFAFNIVCRHFRHSHFFVAFAGVFFIVAFDVVVISTFSSWLSTSSSLSSLSTSSFFVDFDAVVFSSSKTSSFFPSFSLTLMFSPLSTSSFLGRFRRRRKNCGLRSEKKRRRKRQKNKYFKNDGKKDGESDKKVKSDEKVGTTSKHRCDAMKGT